MAKDFGLKFNQSAWNEMIREIVDTDGVDRMKRVAESCNSGIDSNGYRVSTEGGKPLTKHGYYATVITANGEAIIDNARHQTLVQNLHIAGGS